MKATENGKNKNILDITKKKRIKYWNRQEIKFTSRISRKKYIHASK